MADMDAIEHEAEGIAREHGLPATLVRSVLADIASVEEDRPDPTWRGDPFVELHDDPLDTVSWGLTTAARILSPTVALRLFERLGARKVRDYSFAADVLAHGDVPLYTLAELADTLDAYADHLEADREQLLLTGLPRVPFDAHRWLESQLAALYPTKLPMRRFVITGSASQPAARYVYVWPPKTTVAIPNRVPPVDTHPDERVLSILNEDPDARFTIEEGVESNTIVAAPDAFERAPAIPDLSAERAERLPLSRGRVLRAKQDVLRALAAVLRSPSPSSDRAWESASVVLRDSVVAPDWNPGAEWLLACEDWYRSTAAVSDGNPGGSWALLEVVGYVMREISFGPLRAVRAVLGPACSRNDGAPRFAAQSYFDAAHNARTQGGRSVTEIERGLDTYLAARDQERSFWSHFSESVREFLRVGLGVPARAVGDAPWLVTSGEQHRSAVEPSDVPLAAPLGNVFRFDRQREVWVVAFEGKQAVLRTSLKGMQQICRLLAAARVEQLATGLDGDLPAVAMVAFEDGAALLSDQGTVDWAEVKKRRKQFSKVIKDMQAELADAKQQGEAQRAEDLAAKISKLRTIQEEVRREAADPNVKKATDNVRGTIGRAIAAIGREHPELAEHLTDKIDTGSRCLYRAKLDWATD